MMGIGNREQQDAVGAKHSGKFLRHARHVVDIFKYAGGDNAGKTLVGEVKHSPIGFEANPFDGGIGVVAAGDGNHLFREVARGDLVAHAVNSGGDLSRSTAEIKDAGWGKTK